MSFTNRLLIVTCAAVVLAALGDGGPGWLGWLALVIAVPACALACVEGNARLRAHTETRRSGGFVGVLGGAAGVTFGWVAGAAGSLPVAALFTLLGLLPPVGAVLWMRRVSPAASVPIERSSLQVQPTKTASGSARVPAGR